MSDFGYTRTGTSQKHISYKQTVFFGTMCFLFGFDVSFMFISLHIREVPVACTAHRLKEFNFSASECLHRYGIGNSNVCIRVDISSSYNCNTCVDEHSIMSQSIVQVVEYGEAESHVVALCNTDTVRELMRTFQRLVVV